MYDFDALDEALPAGEASSSAVPEGSTEIGQGQGLPAESPAPPRPRRPVPSAWSALVDKLNRNVGLQGRALEAMRLVDRGEFVLPGSNAYDDTPQRIGHNATISAPHMHAWALKLLSEHLRPGCRALDVGS